VKLRKNFSDTMFVVLFWILFPLFVFASEPTPVEKTICLNMIVKNETKVLERCLNSVKDLIDYWVIVDTGSTDGTQDLIQRVMKDVPGELYERPWVNFGHNRDEALSLTLSKADYVLFIDADERLVIDAKLDKTSLDKDYYLCKYIDPDDNLHFTNASMIKQDGNWKWRGVIHEELINPSVKTYDLLPSITCIRDTSNSFRSQDPQKYLKDAKILEEALLKEPDNSRYVFYLAQSYANAKEYEKAYRNYVRRSTMEGWDQEVFWSLLMAGKLAEGINKSSEEIIQHYTKAALFKPDRAEPLFHLANYFMRKEFILLAYLTAREGLFFPLSDECGYKEPEVSQYGIQLLFANAAFKLGKYKEARNFYQKLLEGKSLPTSCEVVVKEQIKHIDKAFN
jgi:glycosyltransferase involved in cell wall biosynthesis